VIQKQGSQSSDPTKSMDASNTYPTLLHAPKLSPFPQHYSSIKLTFLHSICTVSMTWRKNEAILLVSRILRKFHVRKL